MNALVFVILAATPRESLQQARDAFDNYDYAKSINLLQTVLANPPKDIALGQDARALLAYCLFYQHNEPKAREELDKLFGENANYPIDKDTLHPTLVRFAENERAKFTSAPVIIQADAGPQTLGDRQPWLRIFPLGIGHFVNHDHLSGGLFLGTELLLTGANVAASVLRYDLREPNGLYRPNTNPVPLDVLQNAAAFALIAVCAIELIDAFVWSPARGRRTLVEAK